MIKLKVKESDIQKAILDYLKLKRVWCQKLSTTGIYKVKTASWIPNPSRGTADIFALKKLQDGHVQPIGIEVKSSVGKQSKDQEQWQKEFELGGGVYLLVRSLKELEEMDLF